MGEKAVAIALLLLMVVGLFVVWYQLTTMAPIATCADTGGFWSVVSPREWRCGPTPTIGER